MMEMSGEFGLPYVISICFIVILLFFMAEGTENQNQKRCTQTVKEERVRYVYKKISVTRKIPARCSGWDRDWSWITKKDCSDKYRIEYMNDKRQVKFTTYRTEHVCCPDETGSWCNVSVDDSRRPGEPGYTTETHTLLTVLLPVAATLTFIFIISAVIIAMVIIRQRRRRARNGTATGKHSYEFVKGGDSKKKAGSKSSCKSGLPPGDKLGYEAVGVNEKGEIPYSVEVVDGGPEQLTVSNELLRHPCINTRDVSESGYSTGETPLDHFKDIDKETVIDNALLYDILLEGQNRSSTEPSAPPMEPLQT